jgi:hypothetical protein
MTLDEIKLYTAQERIRAYIYDGIGAEMELIENRIERDLLDPDEEKNIHEGGWYKKREKIALAKIAHANKRIDDLQVYIGRTDVSNT